MGKLFLCHTTLKFLWCLPRHDRNSRKQMGAVLGAESLYALLPATDQSPFALSLQNRYKFSCNFPSKPLHWN